MTKKIIWRLKNLPTSDEVLKLVNDKLITKEEAREILFNEEVKEEKSVEDLKSEIKFLKELVEKLSNGNRNIIVETIKYVEKPYYQWGWYQPYNIWTSGVVNLCGSGATNSTGINAVATNCSFTDIQTF